MTGTLVRLDEDHFAYLTGGDFTRDQIELLRRGFEDWWPGKQIIFVRADQFVARPGEYEVVRATEDVDRELVKRSRVYGRPQTTRPDPGRPE